MKRIVWLAGLACLAGGPALAQDKVYLRGNPRVPKAGKVEEETPGGLRLRTPTAAESYGARDIANVTYGDLSNLGTRLFDQAYGAELQGDLEGAIGFYVRAGKGNQAGKNGKKQIDFKVAMLDAQLARSQEKRTAAEAALKKFADAHKDSWQATQALIRLAELRSKAGNSAGAVEALETLAVKVGLPKPLKSDLLYRVTDVLMAGGEYARAKEQIDRLQRLGAGKGTEALETYAIACDTGTPLAQREKKLRGIIAKSRQNEVRAAAYNALGECYLQAKKPREAMWAYLWVDVVYSNDGRERKRAVRRLVGVFDGMNDADRAEVYRRKLKNLK